MQGRKSRTFPSKVFLQLKSFWLEVAIFGTSDCQCSNARNKIEKIPIQSVSTTEELLIETLIKEKKPVFMSDQWGWVREGKKIFRARFRKNRTIRTLKNEPNLKFSTPLFIYQRYILDFVHVGGVQICSGWWIQAWIMSEMNKKYTFRKIRTVNILLQGTWIDSSSIEQLSTANRMWMATMMEQLRPVALVKREIEHREKVKTEKFIWNFRTIKFLTKSRKKRFAYCIPVQKCCIIDWDLDGKSRNRCGGERKLWKPIIDNIRSTFWKIWTATNLPNGWKQITC